MKTITILLPGMGNSPSGGAKIIYEYANRLAADGYEVNIMYPASLLFAERGVYEKFKSVVRFAYYALTRRFKPYHWFNLERRITLKLVMSLGEFHVPISDFYIATALETSEYLSKYRRVDSLHKIYFIQGYESWNFGEERFLKSLKFDLRKIAISPFLKRTIEEMGESAVLIENGLDFSYFIKSKPVQERDKYSISMLYHTQKLKGVDDGLRAISIARQKFPQIKLTMFGHFDRPAHLPKWIIYYKRPDREQHNKIYNETSIFLGTSHSEGFGLTVAESMMCGCAVVCTNNDGYLSICTDQHTALMSPIADPESMSNNIVRLIENDSLRYSIADAGNEMIKKYTWERAYSKLKREIEGQV